MQPFPWLVCLVRRVARIWADYLATAVTQRGFEVKITFAKFARVVNEIVNLAFTLTFSKKGRNRNVLTARCSFLIEWSLISQQKSVRVERTQNILFFLAKKKTLSLNIHRVWRVINIFSSSIILTNSLMITLMWRTHWSFHVSRLRLLRSTMQFCTLTL